VANSGCLRGRGEKNKRVACGGAPALERPPQRAFFHALSTAGAFLGLEDLSRGGSSPLEFVFNVFLKSCLQINTLLLNMMLKILVVI